ncbi:hypothetical protein ASD76_06330 [Altererythrobacter sp. Root672]|nr:hypothetical protein ASD76_06330 [Altererythrobacter sp. Root672]
MPTTATRRPGKSPRKDAAAGNVKFVSLLGRERVRAQARMSVGQAKDHLRSFGIDLFLPHAIAGFASPRDY